MLISFTEEIICYGLISTLVVGIICMLFYKYSFKKSLNLQNKHVVITGGSSGIGKCLAIQAILKGANVTIIARDENKLSDAKIELVQHCLYSTQRVFTVSYDVANRDYKEVVKTFNLIEQEGGPIFMLINCAGTAVCGKVEDISSSDIQKLLDINCLGSIMTTKAVLEGMKSRGEGHVVFTSSQAGLVGIYGFSAYSASKFALRGFAEAIQMEAQSYGVKITVAYPPDTDTPGFAAENVGKPMETKLICETSGLFKPEVVAKQILEDSLAGRFVSFNGVDGFMIVTLTTGMSPCSSFIQLLIEVLLLGPFRIVAVFYLFMFKRIIIKCKTARNQSKKAQ